VFAAGLPGIVRGGINWQGQLYVVAGNSLCLVYAGGGHIVLGEVATGGRVSFDYSLTHLCVASGGRLYLTNGSDFQELTDPDVGNVVDMLFVDGYFFFTDGTFIAVTELNDNTSVQAGKYGSSEADPDRILAVLKPRSEPVVLNRYTIETFDNVGGAGFPFARIDGALVHKGAVSTTACAEYNGAVAFVGGGRNEQTAVWAAGGGQVAKLSTREIDQRLGRLTEAEQAAIEVEARLYNGHEWLYVHAPGGTLVYDRAASDAVGAPVWFELNSGHGVAYRLRNIVRVYDRWVCGDEQHARLAALTDEHGLQFGEAVPWEFGTLAAYAEGRGAVVHALELTALTGRADGDDQTVTMQYSDDGRTYSEPQPRQAPNIGDRDGRMVWRRLGRLRHWRAWRFRGSTACGISPVRLEAQVVGANV